MESPMPESVKKLLADLIEMFGIYGEIIALFRKAEIHPVYILHFDPLYENRILEPLEEAEALRLKLLGHFEQIKYEHQDFIIRFQTDIYNITSDVSHLFKYIFKIRNAADFIKTYNASLPEIQSTMDKLANSIIEFAGFYNESEKTTYENRLKLLVDQLKSQGNKELPIAAKALLTKFLPILATIEPNVLIQYLNNRAVVTILMRLFQYEPWNTLTNPEAMDKVFGNIKGTNDDRFTKIFMSPVAIQSIHALRMPKEIESKVIYGNKEFLKLLYWLYKMQSSQPSIPFLRTLVNINNGNISFNVLIPRIAINP